MPNALTQLGHQLARDKIDSLELSIAAKQGAQSQDLAVRASARLDQALENSLPGEFNADEHIAWYDNEVNKLSNPITNQDQRTKFRTLLNQNRGTFAVNADKLQMNSLQEQEVKSLELSFDTAMLDYTDKNKDPLDTLTNWVTANNYYKESGSRTQRETLDTQEDTIILAGLETKKARLVNSFATGVIKRDQFIQEIENLEGPLREAGILDGLPGQKRLDVLSTLEDIKANAVIGGQAARLANITNNFTGEVKRMESGYAPNPDFWDGVKEQHELNPENIELKNMALLGEALDQNQEFFRSRRNGDLKSMLEDFTKVKETEGTAATGKELEIQEMTIDLLQKNLTAATELYNKNSAEFFKNHPSVKIALADMAADPSDVEAVGRYVTAVVALNEEQGGNLDTVEILNENMLNSQRQILKGIKDPKVYQAQILQLEQSFSQVLDIHGTTAADSVISQIASDGEPLSLLARYAGTTAFNSIFSALNQDLGDLKSKGLEKGKDFEGVKKEVFNAISPGIIAFLETSPGNKDEITKGLLDAAMNIVLNAPFDKDSGLTGELITSGIGSNATQAAEYANRLLFTNHQTTINKGRVKASAPIDRPDVAKALKTVNNNATPVMERIIMDWAKKNNGGNVLLPGDITKLVDTSLFGQEGFIKFDFNELTEASVMVNSNSGTGKAIQVTLNGIKTPLRLKNKDGKSVQIEITDNELVVLTDRMSDESFAVLQTNIQATGGGTLKVDAATSKLLAKGAVGFTAGTIGAVGNVATLPKRAADAFADVLFQQVAGIIQVPEIPAFEKGASDITKETSTLTDENKTLQLQQKQLDLELKFNPRRAGNLDITGLPQVKNKDGSISAVRTISIDVNGLEYVIPTVVNGEIVSDTKAISEFRKTGKHFGAFETVSEATKFAKELHDLQALEIK